MQARSRRSSSSPWRAHRQYYRARGECEVRLPAVLCRLPRRLRRCQRRERGLARSKPRNFTLATFKCRSTLTGTLPTDEDLYNTLVRGIVNSNMPVWNTLRSSSAPTWLLISRSSPALGERKGRRADQDSSRTPVTIDSIAHGKALFTKLECWKCHGPHGEGDGPSAST